MIDIANTPEEALDSYWLCVWRNLVEEYWNYVRKPDEDNDPFYTSGRALSKPHYTFESMRRDKCRSKESIDVDVINLAYDFWERNRSDMKEYFINYTCHMWPDKTYKVHQDVFCNGWIDFGVDTVYPERRQENCIYDASYLSETGVFQSLLRKAMSKATWYKYESNIDKLNEENKSLWKDALCKLKKFVSDVFNKLL